MSSNVDPEEVQAILGDPPKPSDAADVASRDFRRPLRFGTKHRARIQAAVEQCLPMIAAELEDLFPAGFESDLVGVHETSADRPLVEGDDPIAALNFQVGGQPAWIVWDTGAAVAAVEQAVGSNYPAGEPRRLSQIEASVLGRILVPFARHITTACGGAEADEFAVVREGKELKPWDAVDGIPDPHRLEIELSLRGPGEASSMSVYIPALIAEQGAPALDENATTVPTHLEAVKVELSARLRGCDVSLAQLLELEEGDVIPLESRIDDPVILTVEDCPFALGKLGSHRGRLAVRIEHMEGKSES